MELALEVQVDHNTTCCLQVSSSELELITGFVDDATLKVRGRIEEGEKKCLTAQSETSASLRVTLAGGTAGSTVGSFEMIPTLTYFSTEKSDPRLPYVLMPISRNRHFFGRAEVFQVLEKALLPQADDHRDSDGSHLKTYALCGPGGMDKPEILNNFWPIDSSDSVLITSLDPLAKTYIYSRGGEMALPPFNDADRSKFLLAMTGRTDEHDEVETGDAISPYRRPKLNVRYDHTVASVWALETLKKGAPLLEVLSLLDADGTPEYVLEEAKSSHELPGYPRHSSDYHEARAELLQSSLIARERNTKKIIIHRLIQDAARAKMSDGRFNQVFSFTMHLVSSAWQYEQFGFGNELSPLNDSAPTVLTAPNLPALQLLLDAAWFKIMRGDNYLETSPILDMAQSIGEALQSDQTTGAQHPNLDVELRTLLRLFHHHRGVIGLHTNRPEQSLTHFKTFTKMLQDVAGADKTEGGNDQSLGVAWNELGNAYLQNHHYDQAEELSGSTKISINMPLINLAFCYWLQGRLDESGNLFQEALTDREKEYGVDDKTSLITGKLLLGFGHVRAAQGTFEESFLLHQRCLLQYKATIGNNHHRTGDACVALSNHYVRLVQYEAALTLLDQAIKIYGDLDHFLPERARAHYKRSKVMRLLLRADEADLDLRKAMDFYTKYCPQSSLRQSGDYTEEHFDYTVTFWSR
ncbi:hypothetical protein DL98DRAFT_654560 [Cadophora sp. DSE1049]|nr:hypothetical protein DL98DRAFT_654560 [Cadophora sp. DSE1049]